MKNNNIKILVCYHKKDRLLKNEVLVPIHCGRSIAFNESKDGKISDEEYQWLLNNTIGDDTGENISNLNREVNEMTAIYWAWKNYDELGNPDYIGLMHYRRLFNFKSYMGEPSNEILDLLGLDKKTLERVFNNYSFVSRCNNNCCKNLHAFRYYQSFVNLSESYHPILYNQYKKNKNEEKYYCTNMFILSKKDFFNMCEEIFPLMFDVLEKNQNEIHQKFMNSAKVHWHHKDYDNAYKVFISNNNRHPRLIGFMMERVVSLYLIYLHEIYKEKALDVPVYFMFRKNNTFMQNIFSIRRFYQYKIITICGFRIKFKVNDYKTNIKNLNKPSGL